MKRSASGIVLVVLAISLTLLVFNLRMAQAELIGDVNNDGKVDLKDLFHAFRAYGSSIGDPRYDAECDFDTDEDVDMLDMLCIAEHFGKAST